MGFRQARLVLELDENVSKTFEVFKNLEGLQGNLEFSLQAVRDHDELLSRKRRAQPLEAVRDHDELLSRKRRAQPRELVRHPLL